MSRKSTFSFTLEWTARQIAEMPASAQILGISLDNSLVTPKIEIDYSFSLSSGLNRVIIEIVGHNEIYKEEPGTERVFLGTVVTGGKKFHVFRLTNHPKYTEVMNSLIAKAG